MQVFAGDRAEPVAAIGFTEVDFATPADSEFAFTPPEGAKVTEVTPEDHAEQGREGRRRRRGGRADGRRRGLDHRRGRHAAEGRSPRREPTSRGERGEGPDLQAYLAQLPKVSGSWGSGRLLAGTAFSVVITDDGRVAAGAVGPELLYDALG